MHKASPSFFEASKLGIFSFIYKQIVRIKTFSVNICYSPPLYHINTGTRYLVSK